MREVTFQSMFRMSSPNWYSRTSENSMPRPLKTEWYSPPGTRSPGGWCGSRSAALSSGSLRGASLTPPLVGRRASGDFDGIEHPLDDLLGRDVLGLGLVRQDDPMAQDVECNRFDVFGRDVAAAPDEGVRLGRHGQEDGGAWRGAELHQALGVELVVLGLPGRQHELDDVVLDPVVDVDLADHLARPQ